MSDPFIGEIRLFAGNYAPLDWAFCEGQILQIRQNTALYSLLGTTYGGDGINTFALPDLRGRAPMQQGTGRGLTPRRLGETGGSPTATLTEGQMAAHTHLVGAYDGASSASSPAGAIWAAQQGRTAVPTYGVAPDNVTVMNGAAVTTAGGNQSHDNMQPYLGVRYIICLSGIYPPRP